MTTSPRRTWSTSCSKCVDVRDHIIARGGDPAAVFLMFDERTEALCAELGVEIWFPPAAARSRFGDKVETVRLGNSAGVPSVPNVLARVTRFDELTHLAEGAGLGGRLVIQTPQGVCGQTTFFIATEDDWHKHAAVIAAQPEVKVMRSIDCRSSTLEACATRGGTVVGPLMTEIVGLKELTPSEGGWCGNEVFPDAFTEAVRAKASDYATKVGDQLRKDGYRGYFDVDFLIDRDSGEVYLGEINPRVTGASPIANRAGGVGIPPSSSICSSSRASTSTSMSEMSTPAGVTPAASTAGAKSSSRAPQTRGESSPMRRPRASGDSTTGTSPTTASTTSPSRWRRSAKRCICASPGRATTSRGESASASC